jgi:7-keto-8-aminopelargonate synthetase-like enzyme
LKNFQTNHLPGRTVTTGRDGEYLWFSGTDYLGMGHDETFRTFLKAGIERYGLHYGSSRNNSLKLTVYEETETELAKWIGSESALLASSGMWAGQLMMKTIADVALETSTSTHIQYHYAPKVHPALWRNDFEPNSNSWTIWAETVIQNIKDSHQEIAHIICTDGIGSPMVEAFDFSVFANIPQDRSNVWIIVDESHTLGVFGLEANGLYQTIASLSKANVIMISSLNKALGIPGGVIACDSATAALIRNAVWFAGASPPAPAYAYALTKLLETGHYAKANALLTANIGLFRNQLKHSDLFRNVPAYPVFCSENPSLFEALLSSGIMASCFSYPSPNDPPVTRLAISALHQKEDLSRLAEVCNNFKIC